MAFKIKSRRVDQIYTNPRMGHTYEDLKLRRRAFALFSKGMGYKNVAYELGINVYRAKDWQLHYKANDFTWFKKGYTPVYVTPKLKRKIIDFLVVKGHSIKEASRKFLINRWTISRWIKTDSST